MAATSVRKDWTAAEAQAAQERELAAAPERDADPTTPLFQWAALHRLDKLRSAYDKGDQGQLMIAIRLCARTGLVMPDWVRDAFIASYDRVLRCEVKSYDEAFGAPFPKGAHLNALRKARNLRFAVHNEVRRIRACESPTPPLDEGLFERVGMKFFIQKTRTQELYYEAEQMLGNGTNDKPNTKRGAKKRAQKRKA